MDYVKLYKLENESRSMANAGTEKIIDTVADELYMKYVLAKIPDFLGDIYSTAFKNIVEETTISHDNGDNVRMMFNYWKEETEPTPARIDTWARYRITSKVDEEAIAEAEAAEKLKESESHISMGDSALKRASIRKSPSSRNILSVSTAATFTGKLRNSDVKAKRAESAKKSLERRFSYNELFTEPEAIGKFLNAPLYDVYYKAKKQPQSKLLQHVKRDLVKEQNGRRQMREKQKLIEKQRNYEREKREEQLNKEKTKKELEQSRKNKLYTFDFEGNVITLKQRKDNDWAVNDIIDVHPNTSKKPKITSEVEHAEAPEILAEVIEKDNESEKGYYKGQDETKGKPKLVGMFKPQPPLKDLIQVAPGTKLRIGKTKPIIGSNPDYNGRVAKKDFERKFNKMKMNEEKSGYEGTETKNEKHQHKKKEKEEKYRKTVDNWKEEMKQAGIDMKMAFDPEKLIELIMTDEDQLMQQDRLKRRIQRHDKREAKARLKEKLRLMLKDPEKYISRVVAFSKELGSEPKTREVILNEFQVLNQRFNKDIIDKQDVWGEKDGWAGGDDEGQKYRLPKSKSGYIIKKGLNPMRNSAVRVRSGITQPSIRRGQSGKVGITRNLSQLKNSDLYQ